MNQKQERLVILVLFFFSLALRIFFIEQKNLWFDEIFSWHITRESFRGIVIGTAGDIHPPFYYFVLKAWEGLFGTSVIALRSLSALTASLAVFYLYPVSKKILSAENSILVIILYSLSPLNIYFSQEARMAALNLLLNIGAVYYFMQLFLRKRESQQINSIISAFKSYFTNHNFYFYLLFTILSIYTHYFSFFILAAQILFLIYYFRKGFKQLIPFFAGYVIIAFCYAPWINTMFEQVSKGQPWRYSQSAADVLSQCITFVKDISLGFYHRYTVHYLADITAMLILLLLVLSITGLIKYFYFSKDAESKNVIAAVSLIVLVPFLAAVIISFRQWIEYFRYLSIIIPFILLLITAGLNYYKPKIFYPVFAVILIINMFGVYLYYHNESKNNDYRGVLKTLSVNTVQSDIYVYPHYFGWFIDYYREQNKLNIPPAEEYGWEFSMLRDSISERNPEQFRLIMDYHSMDSAKYEEYLEPILNKYRKTSTTTFKIEPNTVKLFEFEKK
jgi:uncharacterized membrane protein